MQRDDKQGKIPSDQVSSQKATGGVNTASQDNSEVNPDSASRPTGSQARMSHSQAQLHQTCKQYSKLQQSRRREPKNVLTRIEKITAGPLIVLKKALVGKRRVKVLIRSAVQMRSICTGYVIVFDRHMNMVLSDVDEVYKNPLLLYKRDPERTNLRKKKTKKKQPKSFYSASEDPAQTLVTCQESLSSPTDNQEIRVPMRRLEEPVSSISSDSMNIQSTQHRPHFGAMNLDGQYDTSSEEESEKPTAPTDDAGSDICDWKTDQDDDKIRCFDGESAEVSSTGDTSQRAQSSHKRRDRSKSEGRVRRSTKSSWTDLSQDSIRETDELDYGESVQSKKKSREKFVRSREPDAAYDRAKDRDESGRNLGDTRQSHHSGWHAHHGSQRFKRTESRRISDQNLRSSDVKQWKETKDRECHTAGLSLRIGQDVHKRHDRVDRYDKDDVPNERTLVSEGLSSNAARYGQRSEKESVTQSADRLDLRCKIRPKDTHSLIEKEFKKSYSQERFSSTERRDNKCASVDEKDRLIKTTRQKNLESNVKEQHSQSMLCSNIVISTTVKDPAESTIESKPKEMPEVLKRHVNKLFIRGDNVVMVVLED